MAQDISYPLFLCIFLKNKKQKKAHEMKRNIYIIHGQVSIKAH